MFQGARKDAHGIAFERAQVDGGVCGCLDLHRDAFQTPPGDFHALTGREHNAATLGFDHGRFGQFDAGGNEDDVTPPCNEGSLDI